MVGYPGSGKTTVSRLIHEQTGAVHIWADHERHAMFQHPTHSRTESDKLYAHLNEITERLLDEGKTVIFDTNFNYYKDRELLRKIAAKHNVRTVLIWMITPRALAQTRATKQSNGQETRIWGDMPLQDFERIANHLEPPRDDEHPIKIDGTHITADIVAKALHSM